MTFECLVPCIHLLVLIQKCCTVGRTTFSWFYHASGKAVLLRGLEKRILYKQWEMLMYEKQTPFLPPEESIPETPGAHLFPLNVFLSLFCLLSLTVFPGGGIIPNSQQLWIAPWAKCSCLQPRVSKERGGAEVEEWDRTAYARVGMGMPAQQYCWNMKWVTLLAPSCIQHLKWSQTHCGLILAKTVPETWCGRSQYLVVLSSWKGG